MNKKKFIVGNQINPIINRRSLLSKNKFGFSHSNLAQKESSNLVPSRMSFSNVLDDYTETVMRKDKLFSHKKPKRNKAFSIMNYTEKKAERNLENSLERRIQEQSDQISSPIGKYIWQTKIGLDGKSEQLNLKRTKPKSFHSKFEGKAKQGNKR